VEVLFEVWPQVGARLLSWTSPIECGALTAADLAVVVRTVLQDDTAAPLGWATESPNWTALAAKGISFCSVVAHGWGRVRRPAGRSC